MSEWINKAALYGKIAELEALARNRVLDTPTNSPAYMRYVAQLHERTALKHLIADYEAVDAVPVVRGKWTPVKYDVHCSCGKSYGTYHYLCSACSHVSYSQPYGLNFCPNCGAKMDGKANEP